MFLFLNHNTTLDVQSYIINLIVQPFIKEVVNIKKGIMQFLVHWVRTGAVHTSEILCIANMRHAIDSCLELARNFVWKVAGKVVMWGMLWCRKCVVLLVDANLMDCISWAFCMMVREVGPRFEVKRGFGSFTADLISVFVSGRVCFFLIMIVIMIMSDSDICKARIKIKLSFTISVCHSENSLTKNPWPIISLLSYSCVK